MLYLPGCLYLLLFSFFFSSAVPLRAEDVNTLLKQVNTELRVSQRDMFSGRPDKAIASLENIETLLARVKSEDPDHPEFKRVENIYTGLVKDLNAKIDKQTFPGQAPDAPPEAEELTRIVLKWFDDHPVWGNRAQNPYSVLKVVITGPWLIQKRNILAESIMYGLPVALAIQLEEEKEKDLVQVFNLILLTEEMKGVTRAPPFHTAMVSSSYYMRPAKF